MIDNALVGLDVCSVFVDYAHTHDALENVLMALRTTMGADPSGPIAGGMLLTQEGACTGAQNREGGLTEDVPSPRQKHGTRPLGENEKLPAPLSMAKTNGSRERFWRRF